jgi:hypothetical protein
MKRGLKWFVIGGIGLFILGVAVPFFIRARRASSANACINNLRQIDAAKQTWALENNKKGKDTPTWDDLRTYFGRGKGELPKCPHGGTYTINCLSNAPQCTFKKDVMPIGLAQ